jgi:hypothetical protein
VVGLSVPQAVVSEAFDVVIIPGSGVCHNPCMHHEYTLKMEAASYSETPTRSSYPRRQPARSRSQISHPVSVFFDLVGLNLCSCDVVNRVKDVAAPGRHAACRIHLSLSIKGTRHGDTVTETRATLLAALSSM